MAQVPVSVRTDEQMGTFGNRIPVMSAPLFTNEPDPVKRLRGDPRRADGSSSATRRCPAELLQDANQFIPPARPLARAQRDVRLATRARTRPTWNLVVSNVPGPQFPLYCAGAKLVANYPVSAIMDGMGLNITVMSYCGHLDFGILADRELMPDVSRVMRWLRESLEELMPAMKPAAAPTEARAGLRSMTPPTLVVIDVQRAFDDPAWGERDDPAAEARVAEAIAGWRERERP